MRILFCDVIIVVVLAKPESSKVTIGLRIRIIKWRKQLRKLMPKSILEHNEGIVKKYTAFCICAQTVQNWRNTVTSIQRCIVLGDDAGI